MNHELIIQRQDWHGLVTRAGLQRAAGYSFDRIIDVVIKEIADNGLDAGNQIEITTDGDTVTVSDDGSGIPPERVSEIFTASRPLASSKLWRRGQRGALGHGMRVMAGATAVLAGRITVESHGVSTAFGISKITGDPCDVVTTASSVTTGTRITWLVPDADMSAHTNWADWAAFCHGRTFDSNVTDPRWLSLDSIEEIARAGSGMRAQDLTAFIGLSRQGHRLLAGYGDQTLADIDLSELHELLSANPAAKFPALAPIGEERMSCDGYSSTKGWAEIDGCIMPIGVEVWVEAERSEEPSISVDMLLMNRTPALTSSRGYAVKGGFMLSLGNAGVKVKAKQKGSYNLTLAIRAPHVPILSSGKAPDMGPFRELLQRAAQAAMTSARKAVVEPRSGKSLKEMCFAVIPAAYAHMSGGGHRWVNARQVMYATRELVLAQNPTVDWYKDDRSFTGTVLPEYLQAHPELDWRIAYDDRGSVVIPARERRAIGLGTRAVESYLSEEVAEDDWSPVVKSRPIRERLSGALVIEKEGFNSLLEEAQIDSRFDVAVVGAKGQSTVAARDLVEAYLSGGLPVMVAHDFDVAGLEIGNVYRRGSWRDDHREQDVTLLGLRLADVEAMGLRPEPVTLSGTQQSMLARFAGEGLVSPAEAAFLSGYRVELNAMTSEQFVAWIEGGLSGVQKVWPVGEGRVIQNEIDRLVRRHTEQSLIRQNSDEIEGLIERIGHNRNAIMAAAKAHLDANPELSWEQALDACLPSLL